MSTVISVENLGKKYTISHQQRGDNSSLREVITNKIASFGRKILSPFTLHPLSSLSDPAVEDFWALKDVSFEVKQGERIGIIGRNGAGKSTLLKILSRITEPTTGRVKIKGRVASLLEVGTGFHPELTGRENIYLNGAILGMGRQEISRKFDEIVAFAEIEKFLDTPVKRYSSGMYVRLAFAVAAHLEPEILIVDEVLAVGDAQFQKKCLGKMEDVGREGRTVLFVSHNITAIKTVCSSGILLSNGLVKIKSNITDVLSEYLNGDILSFNSVILSSCGRFTLKTPYWIDNNGKLTDSYNFGEIPILMFDFNFNTSVPTINVGIACYDSFGIRIFTSHSKDDKKASFSYFKGKISITTKINIDSLSPGKYFFTFGVRDEKAKNVIHCDSSVSLIINNTGISKDGANGVLWHTTPWRII